MDPVILPPTDLLARRPVPQPSARAPDPQLLEAAKDFEAVFVAEMLTTMGLGREPEAFGGGFGAQAFGSLLNEAYAERIVGRGGLGIAEAVYRRLTAATRHE
jgi:Rod binding domain-containing protein